MEEETIYTYTYSDYVQKEGAEPNPEPVPPGTASGFRNFAEQFCSVHGVQLITFTEEYFTYR